MHTSAELRKVIDTALADLKIKDHPKDLYDPIKYMLSLEAKRMRPVLLMIGCDMFKGDISEALPCALAIEVFHNFTLLHDDIMDNAPLRRSQQTVHERWNNNVAILSGDTMFVMACQLMMKAPDACLRDVMDLFLLTSAEVCEGQQLDMDFEKMDIVGIDDYIRMISFKTAVLLAASLKIGAKIAGAPEREADHLYEFGRNIGIAFQLKDDILDVFGDSQLFGKQQGGDILSDKKTFLLLKAMELSGAEEQKVMKSWINNADNDPVGKVRAITEIYESLGIKDLAEKEMEKYYNIAMSHLNEVNVESINKQSLQEFAGKLMVRQS